MYTGHHYGAWNTEPRIASYIAIALVVMALNIGELPGVRDVAAMSGLPPSRPVNANDTGFEGVPQGPDDPAHNVDYYQIATTDYVRTMGIPVVEGRAFGPGDVAGAMVNVAPFIEIMRPASSPRRTLVVPAHSAAPDERFVAFVNHFVLGGFFPAWSEENEGVGWSAPRGLSTSAINAFGPINERFEKRMAASGALRPNCSRVLPSALGRGVAAAVSGAMVLALAGWIGSFTVRQPAAPAAPNTLAVLPFSNDSGRAPDTGDPHLSTRDFLFPDVTSTSCPSCVDSS